MSRQVFSEPIHWTDADGSAIANTTTEALVFPVLTILGNYMQYGRVLRVRAFGRYSTTGSPTGLWALRFGGLAGTVLAQTGALTLGTAQTNLAWGLEILIHTRVNGASGSLFATGEITINTTATAGTGLAYGSAGTATPAAASVDLSIDQDLALTFDWSAASASNTLTGHQWVVESLN